MGPLAAMVALAGMALPGVPTALNAQQVVLRGRGDVETDEYLQTLVRSGAYTLLARDTIVAAGDTLRGTVLVSTATLRLNGVIAGDLVIVDGSVFLRPTARVLGSVRNIAGGYYPSELAVVSEGTRSEPVAPYVAEQREDGTVRITGTERRSPLSLDGVAGLTPPTYDRVNGLTVTLGSEYALPRMGGVEPFVRGRVEYASQRGAWGGGLELAAARRNTEIAVGAERTWVTNERWIRSDANNSISSIVQGKDRRDYYEAERGYVELRRMLEQRVAGTGTRTSNAWVRAQVEDASSLRAGSPWSLFGDLGERPNIQVNDGRITSFIAGAETEWEALTHTLEARAHVEFATDVPDGLETFGAWVADAEWAMPALANHTLEIETHLQGPLPGTRTLPLQRWSFVGGSGTLYTFDDAQFRGDRVALVETAYSIPLTARLRMPLLGIPTLDLLHVAGMAWSADVDRSFEQNVGVRLRYNVVYVRAVTNPRDFSGDAEFSVGVSFPRSARPWQRE